MELARVALARGATAYLDTNALIYLTEGDPAFKSQIAAVMAAIDAARARVITSELALTEVMVKPYREHDEVLIADYERLFADLVSALPLRRDELLFAARLRADHASLRTPDALHLATALLASADVFVTGDAQLKHFAPTLLKWML